MSIFKSTASFRDFQRPEYALKHFIRFCAAKVAITYAMDLMTAIYSICGGIVEQIAGSLGGIGGASVTPRPTISPSKITLSVSNVSFDDLNEEKQIDYTIEPQNATSTGVKFYSENESVARFDSNKLKSVSEGETYIYICRNRKHRYKK